jgi:hypothetical protein
MKHAKISDSQSTVKMDSKNSVSIKSFNES